ncbi:MAG: D-alanyl-D-alanine endopeptidase [Candidatus Competibacterales bacterium]|nr:D-alanyl-D-alanine endopeptidase [Candidatus Competibacterales bacterium]
MRRIASSFTAIVVCFLISAGAVHAHETSASKSPSELQLASVNAAVAYADEDGDLVFGKNAERQVPIASVTKLMTALVVMESGQSLNEWLEFRERHIPAPANAYTRIRIGSELKRGDMLRIALMSSENLATNVLAHHHPGGSAGFVVAMNTKAAALGMTRSRFVDPAGLSPDNRASAADVAKLVRAAYGYPEIRELSTRYQHTARFRQPRYSLGYGNTNPLVASSRWRVDLTKTGYLREAGRCLAMVTEVDGRPLALVLLNSFGTRTPLGDAGRVRRWITTGDGGRIAGAARDYERQQVEALLQGTGSEVSTTAQ